MIFTNSSPFTPIKYEFNNSFMDWTLQNQEYVEYPVLVQDLQPITELNYLSAYWLWDLKEQIDEEKLPRDSQAHLKDSKWNPYKMDKHNIDESYMQAKINKLVEYLNNCVWNPSMIIIHSKKKSGRKADSSRRSDFIGVSRNGPNWQSMISMQK